MNTDAFVEIVEAMNFVAKHRERLDNMLKGFMEENGYSYDNGDLLLLPENYPQIGHKNVKYHPLIKQPILVKNMQLNYGGISIHGMPDMQRGWEVHR